jgi:RNA polymerase sigma factor (sigma-70 family)
MARPPSEGILLAVLSAAGAKQLTDSELLAQFVEGDQTAFAAIVKRHTGLVLGVCRRVLPTVQDAEDACQAVFLVLARKAKTGRWQSSIANWLYTTARRIASKASRSISQRIKRERRRAPAAPISALDEMTGREAFAVLDEELDKLPAIYREPLVLFYLQGLMRDEAAARLGIPTTTLKSQLDRGRKRLADALTKRGIDVGAGLLAAAAISSAQACSPQLFASILATAGGSQSASVAAIAIHGMGKSMLFKKSCWLAAAALVLSGSALGLVSYCSTAEEPARPAVKDANAPNSPAAIKTVNFVVECAEPRISRLVAERAEMQRKQIAQLWLGKELPNWALPSHVEVMIPPATKLNGMAMFYSPEPEKCRFSWLLDGPLDRLLADRLPSFVARTVIATHFGRSVLWAETGIAGLSQSPEEVNRLPGQARDFMAKGRALKLKELLLEKHSAHYLLSCSLVSFLVERKGNAALLAFAKDGVQGDWTKAAAKHYGFIDLVEMEEAWRNWVIGPSMKSFKERAAERAQRLVQTPPPEVALCVTEDGQLAILRPATRQSSLHAAKNVLAYELDGAPIETAVLLQRLKKETAVLLTEGGKVEPIHLRLIKEGTIVLVLPQMLPPPRQVPERGTRK